MGMRFGQFRRPANVQLREKQKICDPETFKIVERRAFFTIEKISAGEELLWDYVYHQKVKGSNPLICICGELAESCRELTKVTNNHDHVVEAILKHVGKNADGNRQYLVKWQGYDALNNSWCDENELYGIDCFTAYEKERRKKEKKLRKGRSMVIKSSSVPDGAVYDNYDSSSGDEDDRCTLPDSAPVEILDVDEIQKNGVAKNVMHVIFTNRELHMVDYNRMKRKARPLVIDYFENEYLKLLQKKRSRFLS